MYVRVKRYFGRGFFGKLFRKSFGKITGSTLRKVAKKVVTNPVLRRVAEKISKNKTIKAVVKSGAETLVDRVISGQKTIKQEDRPKIIEAVQKTVKEIAKIPDLKKLTEKAEKPRKLNLQSKTLIRYSHLIRNRLRIRNLRRRDI